MKKLVFSFVLSGFLFAVGGFALAAPPANLPTVNWTRSDIATLMGTLRDWFAGVVVIIGIAMMLWGAFLFMTAAGDETQIDKAKKTIMYGLMGVAVAILAYGVFTLVESFLK